MSKKICDLLKAMEKDEQKGQEEYDDILNAYSDEYGFDDNSSDLENVQDGEFKHEKVIKHIRRELKCGSE